MKIENPTIVPNKGVQGTYNNQKSEDYSIMGKAIKAYKDELLTGLTDEEREEMAKKIKEYLKAKPAKTTADKQALNNFIKNLLKQYGYKGNCEEYAGAMGANATEATDEETQGKTTSNSTDSEYMLAYQKSSLSGTAARTKLLK